MQPTDKQIDALRELINIGVGHGADVLNTMLNSHIQLQVPYIKVLSPDELQREMETNTENRLASVKLGFKGDTSGTAELIFPAESASKLITAFTGDEGDDLNLDSIRAGTLNEVGNIVLNTVVGSISNILKFNLKYSVPSYVEGDSTNLLPPEIGSDTVILLARTRFLIEELKIEGDVALFFELSSFDMLLEAVESIIVCEGVNTI
ncbi:MAG: chemotaxis protein CheC [Halobacteriota archaeon]|nr:chemotaxis protein CheC [Halobacteriota archaeon]